MEILNDVDELVCLGDSIYEYRFSNEVVRLLKERGAHTILGNHEEGFLGPHGVRARQPEWIDRALLQWLAERPKRLALDVGGKKMLLVHSTPWEPQGAYIYPHNSRLGAVRRSRKRISCSTATPTISWCDASAGYW